MSVSLLTLRQSLMIKLLLLMQLFVLNSIRLYFFTITLSVLRFITRAGAGGRNLNMETTTGPHLVRRSLNLNHEHNLERI